MIVMKFGGTSVEDAAAIERVCEIVHRAEERRPLVVVSACAGVTNELIRAAHAVYDGDREKALDILDRMRTRHRTIAAGLLAPGGERCRGAIDVLDTLFQELRNVVRGVHLLGELTLRSMDTFTSYGERLSSVIIEAALEERGRSAVLVDARSVMLTDSAFTSAAPQREPIAAKAREILQPLLDAGKIIVTQGFIGSTAEGVTTTIGRGGSDYSAALFGAALAAEEIQIWTDVDGMMSTDPRIVAGARPVRILSFDEASELAYFGAKVLHPNTILPAVELGIPVRVLNSRRPEQEGTLIVPETSPLARGGKNVVKAIAAKTGILLINVSSSRMLMAHGFLAKLFSIFAEHRKSVDAVATSEVSVSLTVDSAQGMEQIAPELEKIGETRILAQKAIICIVGEGMKHAPSIRARAFTALAAAAINVEMISEGASEINLTIVVEEQVAEQAVRILHGEFFPPAG